MYARTRHTKQDAGARAGRWTAAALAALAAFALAACDETPVTLPTANEVVISSGPITLYAGDGIEVVAQVVDEDGRVMRTEDAVWSTSDASVVPIISQGNSEVRIVGESPGEATLTASYGALSADVPVTVLDDDRYSIRSFAFVQDTIDAHVNEANRSVGYSAFNGYGNPIDCVNDLVVTSSDESIAEASAAFCAVQITFVGPGTTTITGEVDGVSAQMVVNVTDEGATAFFVDKIFTPGPGQLITYQVEVVDETGAAMDGHPVNFSASGGTLEATSVTTNGSGVASVDWTAPTNLTDLGQDFQIRFRTMLPGDVVETDVVNEFVSTGPTDRIGFYIWKADPGKWQPVGGDTIQLVLNEERTIVANLFDEYDNLIETDGTITSSDGAVVNMSGPDQSFQQNELSSLSPYIDIESAAETTVTLTADLDDNGDGAMTRDLVVVFITP